MRNASYILGLLLAVLIVTPAVAQQLSESDAAPFSMAVHPRIAAHVLPQDTDTVMSFAGALPADIAAVDVIELKWPKSDQSCRLAVGQTGAAFGKPGGESHTVIAVSTSGGAQAVPLDAEIAKGTVGRICIWPTTLDQTAELVVIAALSLGGQDSRLAGFTIGPAGAITMVDTGQAMTVYGWFECVDLDQDGSYELITSRNLDGAMGGLCYHAVRSYDAALHKYAPAPDKCKPYFQSELDWLEWVLTTRDAIQVNPETYINKTGTGPVYVAVYKGLQYGFDTIVELPNSSAQVPDVATYNAARRKALGLVRTYRDELKAWLGGGAYPATWKMPK
jgi:hypothetical protein